MSDTYRQEKLCLGVRLGVDVGHLGQWPDAVDLDSGYRMLPLEMCEMSEREGGVLPAAAGPKPAA